MATGHSIAAVAGRAGDPPVGHGATRLVPLAIVLSAAVSLSGCAHQNSGIRYYEPIAAVDKAGHVYQRNALVASVATDMPGLTELRIGKLSATFSAQTMQVEDAIYDRKGNYVATTHSVYLPGVYPSHTIKAQGEATAKIFDATAAGVTGGILAGAGVSAAGSGLSSIAGAIK